MQKFLIAAVLSATAVAAQAQTFDVKGLRLNESTAADVKRTWPVTCKRTDVTLWQEQCTLKSNGAMTFGDVPVLDVLVLLHDGRVHKVVLELPFRSRTRVMDLMNTKFGKDGGVCDIQDRSCLWRFPEQHAYLVDKPKTVWLHFDQVKADTSMSRKLNKVEEEKRQEDRRVLENM